MTMINLTLIKLSSIYKEGNKFPFSSSNLKIRPMACFGFYECHLLHSVRGSLLHLGLYSSFFPPSVCIFFFCHSLSTLDLGKKTLNLSRLDFCRYKQHFKRSELREIRRSRHKTERNVERCNQEFITNFSFLLDRQGTLPNLPQK
jgi:hypothetical protein